MGGCSPSPIPSLVSFSPQMTLPSAFQLQPSCSQSSPGCVPVHIPSDGSLMQPASDPQQEPLRMVRFCRPKALGPLLRGRATVWQLNNYSVSIAWSPILTYYIFMHSSSKELKASYLVPPRTVSSQQSCEVGLGSETVSNVTQDYLVSFVTEWEFEPRFPQS